MIFNRLRLQGFKSFVDPTELVIAPGLTGVVGPNGCGKSNLLEALRWVMGETSAKSMRGSGMEDVIFAGASTRPARNFAEVSLGIDNTQRLAPAAFNKDDNLEIIRRITRDAGSAFKANGDDVRARDVRMLFADAATGAHSPALVRQGQISELINAKPKARRAILEDAAGIGGLYQRRHEAELKLNGAENNLARVTDVIEQLDSRLGQLARQARQAERYRQIADALRKAEATFLFIRWKGADEERLASETALTEGVAAAAAAERGAAAAVQARLETEGLVPPLRDEEMTAAAILQRLTVERDTLAEREAAAIRALETLAARIEQLEADLERESQLGGDAAREIERLFAEEEELVAARDGHDNAQAEADEVARGAASALRDREVEADKLTEEAARLAAAAQSAERRVAETRTAAERSRKGADEAQSAAAALDAEIESAQTRQTQTATVAASAKTAAEAAEAALAKAETERADAQSAEAEARAAASEAAGELSAVRAETESLERLLAREAGEETTLLDQVSVDPGFESALGAALDDELRAPLTTDGTGWSELPDYADTPDTPDGAARLAGHVKAPAALARRLNRTAIVDRADGARLQASLGPGWSLVSAEGDLWRWDGYRALAEDAPSAAAERLRQQNRLIEMCKALAEAEKISHAKATAHGEVKARLEAATAEDQARRQARRAADGAASDASRAAAKAEADLDMARGRREALEAALVRRREELEAAEAVLAEAEAARADVADPEDAWRAAEASKADVEEARGAMLTTRGAADDLRRAGAQREQRLAEASEERAGWRARADNATRRIAELETRAEEARTEKSHAASTPSEIAARREALAREIEKAELRRNTAADALAAGETAMREAVTAERDTERAAADARERRARLETLAETNKTRVEEAAERIRDEAECEPDELLERIDAEPGKLADAETLEIEIARLRRQRDSLGAVNLRAEEDSAEATEERDLLAAEMSDLQEAIDKLRLGIAELNSEGRERLLAAFDEVNTSFTALFRHLFGGGDANLVLVESEDPLDAGLEIMCMPPGKKLSTLSLLSGGEQTLTALSLIFAVFLANPAPICVLDEVDAPLDDSNVGRFCDLLDEMTRRTNTRFLIITHHAVTMSRMDRLFGVTMAEKGVSQLVSVDLAKAEALVEGDFG
ncbi:MAG: chromosome segregation protein SMC [Paracoccaceae bacterium]|nr:chromosome segregation protein SMC [Paracoccaceae bacterium]MDG1368819.1 chromosome segregation protein SMC [Paracoccaceae bacterium]